MIPLGACTKDSKPEKKDIRLPTIKLPLGIDGQISSKRVESDTLFLSFKVNEYSSHEDIERTLRSIHRQVGDIVTKKKLGLDIRLYPLTGELENNKDSSNKPILASLTHKQGKRTPVIENSIERDLVAFAQHLFEKKKISTGDISQFVKQIDTQTIEIASDFKGEYADLPKNSCERLSIFIEALLSKDSPVKKIRLNDNPSVIYTANNEATSAINDFMHHVAATRGELANKLIGGAITEKRVEQKVNSVKAKSCAQALALASAKK